ncbi:hypothetical protein K9L97_05155 [Candidatus Woesearchaeota archaeon]|nr:hypothetical protein [Candidatus Woesearchaeota archaeon]
MATSFPENPKNKFVFTTSNTINEEENNQKYISAREEADQILENNPNLVRVATMLDTIRLQKDDDFVNVLKKTFVDTTSAQYHGHWKGHKFIVAHGFGELSDTEVLKEKWNTMQNYGFMPIDKDFFKYITKQDSQIAVYTFKEMREGKIKDRTQPRIIISEVKKDKDFEILPSDKQIPISLAKEYGIFQMFAGGVDDANELADYYQNIKGRDEIYVVHRLDNTGFKKLLGRPLCRYYGGVAGYMHDNGVFAVVGDGVANLGAAGATAQKIKTIDDTIHISDEQKVIHKGIEYQSNGQFLVPKTYLKK